MLQLSEIPSREIRPGFFGQLVHGDQSTLSVWDIHRGSVLETHQHIHEQITYVIEGKLEMVIGGESMLLVAGSIHVIPSNTPHAAVAITDCRVIDVFAPARDDYR